jgi:chromosome partitioning protein
LEQEDGIFKLLVNRPPIRDVVCSTGRPNFWLLPGGKRTKTAEGLMVLEKAGVSTLRSVMEEKINGSGLHYLVLDTAPSAGGLQENALYAADLLVIPSAVAYLSLEGVKEVLNTLKGLKRPQPPTMRILPTFYDKTTRESRINLGRLRDAFGEAVVAPIHRAVKLRASPAVGQTIFEYAPKSRAAEEYASLVWEVIDVTKR